MSMARSTKPRFTKVYHHIILKLLEIYSYITIVSVSAMDGDQPVDFYWIDPLLSAERIAGRTKYAKKLYLQFEPQDSWERPGVRAFGRVNAGLVFESAYMIDPGSVPLMSVFYGDKSFLKGMTHHPIYRKCLFDPAYM